MFSRFLLTFFLTFAGTAQAVSIYPNVIQVEGKAGSIAPVQFEIYGHPDYEKIEFVQAESIREDNDKVLAEFVLGTEQRTFVPIDIVIPDKSREYYICAVLKSSQSMRLRVCSLVQATVTQTR